MTRLRRAYLHLNRKYFDNQLPKDLDVVWINDFEDVAEYEQGVAIRINALFKRWKSIWKLALLHEMCHVRHPNADHNRTWKREMMRLAQAGAFDQLW